MQSSKNCIRLTDVCVQLSFGWISRTVKICYAPIDQRAEPSAESRIPFEALQGANDPDKDFLCDILDIRFWYCKTNSIVDHRKITLVQDIKCIQAAVFGCKDEI